MTRSGRVALLVAALGVAGVLVWWRWPTAASDAPTGAKGQGIGGESGAQERPSPTTRYSLGAKAPLCEVEGTVKGDGRGIAGATVRLLPRRADLVGAANPGALPPPIILSTDGSGSFRAAGIVDGPYSVSASHPDWVASSVELESACGGGGVALQLFAGGVVIAGSVSDVLGGPVAGAVVSASDPMDSMKAKESSVSALTDPAGRYRLRVQPGTYAVMASHSDYVPAMSAVTVSADTELDLTLTPGAVVEGVVLRREGGEPVAGARVSASAGRGLGGLDGGASRTVTADEQGRFRLSHLDSGLVRLSARHRGLASREAASVSLSIAEHVTGVEVYVDAAFEVSGRVVAKDDPSRGIAGAHVALIDVAAQTSAHNEVPTSSDGAFVIHGVRPGMYMLNAIGGGAMARFMAGNITVEDADVSDVTIEMDRGSWIRGRVSPAASASIGLDADFSKVGMFNAMSVAVSLMSRARTRDDGTFELGPVGNGSFAVVAEADDGRRGRTDVEVSSSVDGVVVALDEGVRIAGRVVDQGGNPLSHVFVAASGKGGSLKASMDSSIGPGGNPTDDGGRFEIRVSSPGEYELAVSDRRGPLPRAGKSGKDAYEKYSVDVGEAGVNDVELKVEAANRKIRGVVVDGAGAPVRDAWVRAELELEDAHVRAPVPTLTDEAGRFELTGLRQGLFTVGASSASGELRAKKQGVRAGDSVRLQLSALGRVSGLVHSAGAPVHPYVVHLRGDDELGQSARVFASDGRFELERVEPGKYRVQAKAELGTTEKEVTVGPGQHVEVVLELAAFGRIRGRLVDEAGSPIGGAAVWVMPKKGDQVEPDAEDALAMISGQGPKTGDDGRFLVPKVVPGKVSVMFFERGNAEVGAGHMSIGGQPLAIRDVSVAAGDELELGDVRKGQGLPEESGEAGEAEHE